MPPVVYKFKFNIEPSKGNDLEGHIYNCFQFRVLCSCFTPLVHEGWCKMSWCIKTNDDLKLTWLDVFLSFLGTQRQHILPSSAFTFSVHFLEIFRDVAVVKFILWQVLAAVSPSSKEKLKLNYFISSNFIQNKQSRNIEPRTRVGRTQLRQGIETTTNIKSSIYTKFKP